MHKDGQPDLLDTRRTKKHCANAVKAPIELKQEAAGDRFEDATGRGMAVPTLVCAASSPFYDSKDDVTRDLSQAENIYNKTEMRDELTLVIGTSTDSDKRPVDHRALPT